MKIINKRIFVISILGIYLNMFILSANNNDLISDTILNSFVYHYPVQSSYSYDSYGEGFYKDIRCINDNCIIVIHFGPAIFNLNKNRTIIDYYENQNQKSEKGYEMYNGEKKFYRMIDYKNEPFTIYYFLVDSLLVNKYDNIIENSKIINSKNRNL